MHKRTFYPRLALGNLKRNKSTYLPYMLACVVSVFTFYIILSINTNGALNNMRGESILKSFTAIGTVILGIFCSILLFYTNSFLIKRRKKELGLYSILGMEKKNIAILLFWETLFIAALALVAGIAIGTLLSRVVFLVLLRMARFSVSLSMPFSPSALGITVVFFTAVFLLTMLTNLRQVRLANPITLLGGARQGEREPKASWLTTLLGIVCIAGGYGIAIYFQSPIEALMFFLVAVLLVIIGTYCLFTSGSVALLKLLRRNKNYYYKPNHFIAVSGMIYRMKQNAAGLSTICILSCMVLVTVSATVSLNAGAEDSLMVRYPTEHTLGFENAADGDTIFAEVENIAAGQGLEMGPLYDYRYYSTFAANIAEDQLATAPDMDSVGNTGKATLVCFVPLEDYQPATGTAISPPPGGALLFCTGGSYSADHIIVNGIRYPVTPLDSFAGTQSGATDIARTITLFIPGGAPYDAALEAAGAAGATLKRSILFDMEGSDAAKSAFYDSFLAYTNNTSTQAYFQYNNRDVGREDWFATNGGFLFLGIYFGVLFLLAAALIIYYKQISEGYDDAERFDIMQRVGMSEREVRKAINGQILTVFFLPLGVAILHVAVAFWPISHAMVLFGVINRPLMALSTLLTILVYALLYTFVYRRTARSYFQIVRRQGATA